MTQERERGVVVVSRTDRIVTLPNVLSVLRLFGAPFFLWAIVTGHDTIALATLMLSGVTDYLDGKIARTYGLVSRVGEILDPIADRLYILSTLLGLSWRDIIPWWLVAVLLLREAFLALLILIATRNGLTSIPIHFIGKAATFNLLYAFPLLLLADGTGTLAAWALPIGWAFAWWGMVLYWLAGILYAVQVRRHILRERPA